jgi:WD40 repeat protein
MRLCQEGVLVFLSALFWLFQGPTDGPAVCANQPVGQGKPARLDLHGDPLPNGAVARFGTERLRPGRDTSALTFTGDGKLLVSAHGDGYLELWDGSTGQHRGRLISPTGAGFTCLACSADGKHLAAGDEAQDIWIWDLGTGKPPRPCKGHGAIPRDLSFSPDGKTLASVAGRAAYGDDPDFAVRLWDVATGQSQRALLGHTRAPDSVTFLGDGKRLVSIGYREALRVWEVATGKELGRYKVPGMASKPLADGMTVAVVQPNSQYSRVGVFDPAEDKWLREPFRWEHVVAEAPAPDGQHLALATDNGLDLVAIATGESLQRFTGHGYQFSMVAFAPNGKRLAAATPARLYLWDTATGKEATSPTAHHGPIQMIRFLPEGKQVLTVGIDGTARLWEADTGKSLQHFTISSGWIADGVDLSPDGRTLAVPQRKGQQVVLWDVTTGKPAATVNAGGCPNTTCVAFSPDGKTLAVAAYYPSVSPLDLFSDVRLLDAADGRLLQKLDSKFFIITALLFSPDGKFLVISNNPTPGSYAHVFDVVTGKEVSHFPNSRALFCLVDGPTIGLATGDRHLETGLVWWNPKAGKVASQLPESPNTRFLGVALGSDLAVFGPQLTVDGVCWLRDLKTGKLLARVSGHRGRVETVAFSADGHRLATGGADGTILI